MEFQTRNGKGEIRFFTTLREAYDAYLLDLTIWKISWDDSNRWIPKKKYDRWSPASEQKLESINETYKLCQNNSDEIFWVNQLLIGPRQIEILTDQSLNEEQKDLAIVLDSILDIRTTAEFIAMFNQFDRNPPVPIIDSPHEDQQIVSPGEKQH